jgi:hypothetical protein
MLRRVTESGKSGLDLDGVLLAVEKAAPPDAVEAVTRTIGVSLDALRVSRGDWYGGHGAPAAPPPAPNLAGEHTQDG